MLVFPYTYLERVRLLVVSHAGNVLDEEFSADVTLTARLRVENLPTFQSSLSDLTKGKVTVEVIETGEILTPISF
jgi:putative IMPACT (imprinted ancient) family translation regulator